MRNLHIIAANPSGAKATNIGQTIRYRHPFDAETRRGILARLNGPPVHVTIDDDDLPTFGERVVEFFRRHQDSIGIACFVIAVLAGCYFAFKLGRGVGL